MRVYISGPMTGIPEHNKPAFDDAHIKLIQAGHEPVNPADQTGCNTYQEYMRADLKDLLTCEGIFMLDGWRQSKGACVEHLVATTCGIEEVTI